MARKTIDALVTEMLAVATNLGPADSGTGFYIHVFQDFGGRASHGPRILVRRQSNRGTAWVTIPTRADEKPGAVPRGKAQFGAEDLAGVIEFVEKNRAALLRYWTDDEYGSSQLIGDLVPVRNGR